MRSVNEKHAVCTSLPWESIWSTQCHPKHSRGPSPGSIRHRPSHKPHTDAKASGKHQYLNPGRVVAVQVKKRKSCFQYHFLGLNQWYGFGTEAIWISLCFSSVKEHWQTGIHPDHTTTGTQHPHPRQLVDSLCLSLPLCWQANGNCISNMWDLCVMKMCRQVCLCSVLQLGSMLRHILGNVDFQQDRFFIHTPGKSSYLSQFY